MDKQNTNGKLWVELANGKRTTNIFIVIPMLPYLIVRSFWKERAVIKEHRKESKNRK